MRHAGTPHFDQQKATGCQLSHCSWARPRRRKHKLGPGEESDAAAGDDADSGNEGLRQKRSRYGDPWGEVRRRGAMRGSCCMRLRTAIHMRPGRPSGPPPSSAALNQLPHG